MVQDLGTQWIQAYPCKQKLHRKPRETCKSPWSPIVSLKSFTLTIPRNLAKPMKIFPGIIVRRHHTDRSLCASDVSFKNRSRDILLGKMLDISKFPLVLCTLFRTVTE